MAIGWERLGPGGLGWISVHEDLPLEVIVAGPSLGEGTGFLGVYPRPPRSLEARVFKGRALWEALVSGRVRKLYLNAVADPKVLWDAFKGRLRARWTGVFMEVESSYLVIEAVIERSVQSGNMIILTMTIKDAWHRPILSPPPSRIVGNLLDLMVALTRVEPLCREDAGRLGREISVSLHFLRRRLPASPHKNLLGEVEEEVRRAVEKCPRLGDYVDASPP